MAVIMCHLCDKIVDIDYNEVYEYGDNKLICESCEDDRLDPDNSISYWGTNTYGEIG